MKLEVRVVSKEIITPSHPTPNNLRRYSLSFLDQISPPVYNPLVLFYTTTTNNDTNAQRSKLLKESLSKVLSLYYPLAGCIDETNSFAFCNDEGVPYVETEVNSQISDVLGDAVEPDELSRLVPFQLHEAQEVAVGVQFNRFRCGGIAIGLCVSHKVADASSTISFVKAWAAIARGEPAGNVLAPEFVSFELFPPRDDMSGYKAKAGIMTSTVVAKRFVFKADSIEALGERYARSRSLESKKVPSRIETLSVFIWSRLVKEAVTRSESRTNRSLLLLHAVNLRTRMDPPLPEHSFGNYYRVAVTVPNNDDAEEEEDKCGSLISLMRESISKVDKGFVKSLQGGGNDEHFNFIRQQSEAFMKGEAEFLNFTSLCRFPRYESDFGWGKPSWVGTPCLTFKNLVVFMDSAADGIEALIHLDEAEMGKFQQDQVLLQYAS
ncbi:Stemmadenine O-acetyltransferase [Linum perenne]